MKSQILFLAVFISFNSFSQDCTGYWYFTKNAEVQMTIYDQKGKPNGVQTWTVSDVIKDGNGFASTLKTNMKDEKGKQIAESTGAYKCKDGVLQADIKMSMPQEQMQAYKPTEAKLDAVYIDYPYNMSAGQLLADATFNMDMTMGNGGMPAKLFFNETNRKVEAKETITTPAGTWEAYKISYEGLFKVQMSGIGIPVNMVVNEWFVPGFGVVKTETFNKKGKLMGSTVLTSIKK
jgi:hypothetical protein